MERLSTALQNYHVEVLQTIAERLALPIKEAPVRKAQLVGQLARHIPKIARSRTHIGSLSAAEQAALAVMLAEDAEAKTTQRDLALPLMLSGLVKADQRPQDGNADLPTIHEVVQALLSQGLLISLTNANGASALRTLDYVEALGVAPEVRAAIPQDLLSLPSVPPQKAQWDETTDLEIREHDVRQYMRMLFFTWSELRRRPAWLLKAGGMGKRDRRRIAEALGLDREEDLEVISRFYEMLAALQLVTSEEGTIAAVESDAVTLFWGARLMGQLPALIRAYTQVATELPTDAALDQLTGYFESISLQSPYVIREQAIEMLHHIAPLGWISTEMFHNLLCGGRPGSMAFGGAWLDYIYRHSHWYGDSYWRQIEETLRKAETQLVHTLLDELYTLGLVVYGEPATKGKRQSNKPVAIRVSEAMQAYVARTTDAASHTPTGRDEAPWQVILQPDFQMLAMGPVPLRVLANLENFVHREKIDESVITYRITRDDAYEAFRRDETVAAILGYLTEATDQPVPQNIIRSLEEWYAQFERIVIHRNVCIFQADSSERLEALLDDPTLSQFLQRISADLAWMRPDDSQRVEARLQELEILPAQARQPKDDLQDSLRWHREELEPRSPTPSIYVTGYLQRVAEPHNDRWRITPESTKRAADLGLEIPDIQATLEEMTGSQLPDLWDKRLKAWGNHFGDAKIGDVRLLRLDQADALESLREADRQLHRWLRPLAGAPQLAIVDDRHWEEVQDLLASWGVNVKAERWW